MTTDDDENLKFCFCSFSKPSTLQSIILLLTKAISLRNPVGFLKLLKSNDPLPFDAAMSIVFSDLYHKKLRSSLLVRARAAVSQKIVKLQ